MRWSDDALNEMERVPFFIRNMVRKKVEAFARQQGSHLVVPDHLEQCRQRFMKDQQPDVKGYRLETCFGAKDCSNRVFGPTEIVQRLDEFLGRQGLRDFLQKNVSGPLKMHHEFRVSVSFCPNSCSRPQIVDIGIIGALRPAWAADKECNRCNACIDECEEGAIMLVEDAGPLIDCERCLCCGKCITVCPSSVLIKEREGFRVLVGGKLGRHPQLAHELPGIFSEDEVLAIVEKIVGFYMGNSQNGERLGSLVKRKGLESLYQFIGIPSRDIT